ncbi:MAG: hypothetical protein IK088_09900 [Lachnospiraceae bacterium]|nr:hypothetical protein [Lachnospiraceae bacterium]
MNIESCSYKLLTGNCDVNRRLRLSELFNWFQEAAIRHTEIMGMGRTKTLDRGLLWIVIQWRVEIERLPEYDEIVTVETWPGTTMHVFFPRYFRIKDSKGHILVQASSLWALMDQETRHVVFPEEAGIAIEGTAVDGQPVLPKPPRIGDLSSEQTYTVSYSVLDLNGHMNNTRYFDLVQDVLYREKKAVPPKLIQCEYSSEAKYGETITVKYGEADHVVSILGEADRRVFRMTFTYE